MRIRVYAFGENPRHSSPRQHVSKSTAQRWCEWGTHAWIAKATIRERYPDPFRVLPGRPVPALMIRYSPDKLPPLELPQVHFEEPQSAAWRETHRKVTLPH